MSDFTRMSLVVLAVAGAVAGCAQNVQNNAPPGPGGPGLVSVFGYNNLTLAAGGYNALGQDPAPPASVKSGSSFSSPQAFVNAMSRIVGGCPNVVACAARMQAQNKFDGVAGTSSRLFSQIAHEFAATGDKPDYEVRGQITDRCPNDPSQPGYQYDSAAKTARLCVITETVIDRGNRPPVYQFYDVSAVNVGVAPRVGNRFPQAAEATGLDVHVPGNSPFDRKLYAAGNNIQVTAYWVTQFTDSTGAPDWSRGGKHNPSSGLPIFRQNSDSCIDMMFESDPPPTFPPGYEPGVKYCLGRCATPPIVNTM